MDRLVELLKYFSLHARVFQSGPLCRTGQFDQDGFGYIHILESGECLIESPDHEKLVLSEPSVFVYMNPTSHRLTPLDQNVRMVCATFEFGREDNPLLKALPTLIHLPLSQCESLTAIFQVMFTEAREHHCGRQAVLDRLMEVILIHFMRDLMDKHLIDSGLLAGMSDSRLVKAIQSIHESPQENWTLEILASKAGMSRARFADHFREVVGMTPGAYLTEWRLGIARTYLKQNKPLQWIADQVGYADASAFSRVFKQHVGLSPSVWQKAQHLEVDSLNKQTRVS